MRVEVGIGLQGIEESCLGGAFFYDIQFITGAPDADQLIYSMQ